MQEEKLWVWEKTVLGSTYIYIYIYIYFDLYDQTLSDVIISYDSRKGYPQADDQY